MPLTGATQPLIYGISRDIWDLPPYLPAYSYVETVYRHFIYVHVIARFNSFLVYNHQIRTGLFLEQMSVFLCCVVLLSLKRLSIKGGAREKGAP